MSQPKKTEQKLIQSVLDNLPGLVFRVINDGEWTFQFASQGAMDLLGYAPEKLVSTKAFSHLIPKEDREKNKRILSKVSAENPHYEAVYRISTAPGIKKWVKEEGTGVFSNGGELVALDGFLVDITEQKSAELELREENLNLKSNVWNILTLSRPVMAWYESRRRCTTIN